MMDSTVILTLAQLRELTALAESDEFSAVRIALVPPVIAGDSSATVAACPVTRAQSCFITSSGKVFST